MEKLLAHSNNLIKLNDRILWYDGDSTVSLEYINDAILLGNSIEGLFIDEMTPEIEQYNKFVIKSKQIKVKTNFNELLFDWNIPDEYKNLDVISYVSKKLLTVDGNKNDIVAREIRCAEELSLFVKLGYMNILKSLIYIIDTLLAANVVWGVGRGSSVSSYVLYLIGVHDIDSFQYNLDIHDFLKTDK